MSFLRLIAAACVAVPVALAAFPAAALAHHGAPAHVMMSAGHHTRTHMVSYHRHHSLRHHLRHNAHFNRG